MLLPAERDVRSLWGSPRGKSGAGPGAWRGTSLEPLEAVQGLEEDDRPLGL